MLHALVHVAGLVHDQVCACQDVEELRGAAAYASTSSVETFMQKIASKHNLSLVLTWVNQLLLVNLHWEHLLTTLTTNRMHVTLWCLNAVPLSL